MCTPARRVWRFSPRFTRDESGALTVEAVLWLPLYMAFFALISDVSFMIHGQTQAARVAHDANRLASIGFYENADEVKAMELKGIQNISPNAVVEVEYGTETVSTSITIPSADLQIVGFFARFGDIDITAGSMHLLEI